MLRQNGATRFAVGWLDSAMASRAGKGTMAFITTQPGLEGLKFVVSGPDGPLLTLQEGQHTYRVEAE